MSELGCPDKPISKVENDLFNVHTYVAGLCQFVRTCATPMTISIQGDWGSGKTSMMNMMKAELKDEVYPIWFNTWQFSQFDMGNSLAFSMLAVLFDKLGCEESKIKTVFKGIMGFTKNAINVMVDAQIGGAAAEKIGEIMAGPEQATNYAKDIE